MFCPNCGSQVPDNSNFCPQCATPMNNQFNANNDGANQQAQYNQQYYQQYNQPPYNGYGYNPDMPNPKDVPSPGLNVLSFFIPLVGLILYIFWKDEYPIKAKKIGKAALASVIVSAVFYILFMVVWFGLFFTMGISTFEYML